MACQQDFALGLSHLDLNDPKVNPFSDGSGTNIYGDNTAGKDGRRKPIQPLNFGQRNLPAPSTNAAPLAAKKPVRLHHPAAASALHATTNMTSWLQQNHPNLLVQMAQQGNHPNMGTLPANASLRVPGVPTDFTAPPVPMARHYGNITKKLKHWNLQMTKQITEANEQLITADQRLRSAQDEILDLKYRLVTHERHRGRQTRPSTAGTSEQSYATSPSYGKSQKRFAARPYQAAMIIPSPTDGVSSTKSLDPPCTPIRVQGPPTPKQPAGKRHYRTATPEQRQIRAFTQAPIYTLGIDPQTDRGLLCDFFENIKKWAAIYTVQLRALNAEQIHNLAAHPAIASSIGHQPSQLVTEQGMLVAIVSAVISRYIFFLTIDDHALYLSRHPNSALTEHLAYELLYTNDLETKVELLGHQREVYTAIKNAPDHKVWRDTCAQCFTATLMSSLTGLLVTNMPPLADKERSHLIQELFVKGYRIGFRLRMAAVRWRFSWPGFGAGFDAKTMVNESRMLYGDAVETMKTVGENPGEHVVRFAVSPTVWKEETVVHSSLVEITRKGWL